MPRTVATIPTPAPAESVVFPASGKLAAAVCGDHKLRIWSLPGAALERTLPLSDAFNDILEISPDGRWIVTGDHHGDGMVWDAAAGKEYCELLLAPYPGAAAFSRDSRFLAAAPMGGTLQVLELASRHKIFEIPPAVGGANAIAFSPDGSLLATVDGDTAVRIYDARTGKPVARNTDFLLEPLGVAFSGDGKLAIAGGADKVVAFIDTATGKSVRRLDRTAEPAALLRVSLDGKSLAIAFMKADNLLQPAPIAVVDIASTRRVTEWLPSSRPLGGAWTEDGHLLVATATKDAIQVWQL
jgi:WD40 repeat protein